MFDVATVFDDLAVVSDTDTPLWPNPGFRDPHPAAETFLAASEEERDRLREEYRLARERRKREALEAPRPLPREQRPFKVDDKLRTYIRQAVRVGVSLRELAGRLNVSRQTIKNATEPKKRLGRPPAPDAVRAQIRQLSETNISQSEIARRLGVSRKLVWKVLQE